MILAATNKHDTHINPLAELGIGPTLAKRIIAKPNAKSIKKLVSILSAANPELQAPHLAQANSINTKQQEGFLQEISDPARVKVLIAYLQSKIETLTRLLSNQNGSYAGKFLRTLKKLSWKGITEILAVLNPLCQFNDSSFIDGKFRYIQKKQGGISYSPQQALELGLYTISGKELKLETLNHTKVHETGGGHSDKVTIFNKNQVNFPTRLLPGYTSPRILEKETEVVDDENEEQAKIERDKLYHETNYEETGLAFCERSGDLVAIPSIKVLGTINADVVKHRITGEIDRTKQLGAIHEDIRAGLKSKLSENAVSQHQKTIKLKSGEDLFVFLELTDLDPSFYTDQVKPLKETANSKFLFAEIEDSEGNKRLVATAEIL